MHVFNQQVCEEDYLVGETTCESSRLYYHSCVCGAKGETVFTYGDIYGEHQWSSGVCSRCNLICWHEGGWANCSSLAVCDCCGESYGELGDHEYYERNEIISEANCVSDGEIRYYCFCGDYTTEIVPAHGHKWKGWSEYTAVSCSSDGERIRGCHNCLEIDREVIGMVDHSYTKVKSETTAEGVSTITLVCCYCDAPAGESYEGFYLQSSGVMLLENCPNNYSFTVYCEGGEEYLRSTLRIGRLHFLTAAMDGDCENLENYLVEDMGGGV